MKATLPNLGERYTVELWFWNGLPADVRAVTGFIASRGAGDHLLVGGSGGRAGRLVVEVVTGSDHVGQTAVGLKAWHHVALVRDTGSVAVYLYGKPEIPAARAPFTPGNELSFGGRGDGVAGWEGKLDEVAVYDRPLTADEIARHFAAVR